MSNPHPSPEVVCVPCQKEIICSRKAGALIDSGHALLMTGQMTAAKLDSWNLLLDSFIGKAEDLLSAA